MKPYETFEHASDIGIRGYGRTLEDSFCHAAEALYSVMVKLPAVEQKEKRTISVFAEDRELLLVEWLNALLSLSDIERVVFSKFEVHIAGLELRGYAWGEKLDREKHEPTVEIKGASYHMLSVTENESGFTASCVVDV